MNFDFKFQVFPSHLTFSLVNVPGHLRKYGRLKPLWNKKTLYSFFTESRGLVDMKGKGKQETYWLLGDTEKNEVFIHIFIIMFIFIHLWII